MTSNSQKKTVIISGANGYFGSIASQYFAAQGWQILKATRQTGTDFFLDLDKPDEFANHTIDTEVDLFIHAAAAHEVKCREYPYRSVCQNVVGTKAALDFCVLNKIPKFVYLSTFHVFGRPLGIINESTQPLPANDYGLSHLLAEEYVQMYGRENKIQGLVVRPSNFFGVPINLNQCQRWSLTPLGFCREAIENKKIVLRTPGYQQRNFVSVLDVCAAINSVSDRIDEIPLLHVYGTDTLSIRDLAQLVQKIMRQHLHEEIALIMPEGVPTQESFVYTSLYLSNFYHSIRKLEDFVIKLCQQFQTEKLTIIA